MWRFGFLNFKRPPVNFPHKKIRIGIPERRSKWPQDLQVWQPWRFLLETQGSKSAGGLELYRVGVDCTHHWKIMQKSFSSLPLGVATLCRTGNGSYRLQSECHGRGLQEYLHRAGRVHSTLVCQSLSWITCFNFDHSGVATPPISSVPPWKEIAGCSFFSCKQLFCDFESIVNPRISPGTPP